MNRKACVLCILGLIVCSFSYVLGHLAYADSLIGNGINLNVKGNVASGTLVLNGKYFTASNLNVLTKPGQMQLVGYIDGNTQSYLMITGLHTKGTIYQFNGMIQNNGKATPVSFMASLNIGTQPQSSNISNKPSNTITNQAGSSTIKQTISKTKQDPSLPMLILSAQSNLVYVDNFYLIAVKIFDPKLNPTKSFDQFTGGISGAKISVIVFDQNNKIFGKMTGTTDSKGTYQDKMYISYLIPQKEQMTAVINATKNGYGSQQSIVPFQVAHLRQD